MKKPKKRYELRSELLVAIEDCQHRIKMAMKLGEGHNKEADRLRDELAAMNELGALNEDQKKIYHAKVANMKRHREKAEQRIRSLPRRNGDLGRLKAALGVFDTVPFDFMGSDKSVTA